MLLKGAPEACVVGTILDANATLVRADKISKAEYDDLLASAAHARATGTPVADEGDAAAPGPRHRARGRKGRR